MPRSWLVLAHETEHGDHAPTEQTTEYLTVGDSGSQLNTGSEVPVKRLVCTLIMFWKSNRVAEPLLIRQDNAVLDTHAILSHEAAAPPAMSEASGLVQSAKFEPIKVRGAPP